MIYNCKATIPTTAAVVDAIAGTILPATILTFEISHFSMS